MGPQASTRWSLGLFFNFAIRRGVLYIRPIELPPEVAQRLPSVRQQRCLIWWRFKGSFDFLP